MTLPRRSPLTFFGLTLVLASPFWILGTLVRAPGGVPMDLPWAALSSIAPMAAALILVHWEEGLRGVRALLKRSFDYRPIRPAI
jgi:hypothetical protein